MTYEVELIGTVIGRDADDYEVEFYNDSDINTLRSYSFRESSIRFSSGRDAEKYKTLNLKDGVKVRVGIYVNEDGESKCDIIERIQTYERRTLDRYLDILMEHNKVNHMVPEIMAESDQIPVNFGDKEEISTEDIKNVVSDGEVFTDNPNYQSDAGNFNLYDNNGRILFSIEADSAMSGTVNRVKFSFPFETEDDREAFLDFCDRLQAIRAVKYPKTEN